MVMTDPIADMFTRIRNAARAGKKEVIVPYSSFKEEIARVLKKEGFVAEVKKFKEKGGSRQHLSLSELEIGHIQRLSKPGQRWYVPGNRIPNPPTGIRIISTSQGVMTHTDARRKKLGGELVGEVWR